MQIMNMFNIGYEWLQIKSLYIKKSTYEKYEKIIMTHLVPYFKDEDLSVLSTFEITQYIHKLLNNDHYSISLCKSIKSVLEGILIYAEEQYHINHIDFHYIKFPTRIDHSKTLTSSEEKDISHYCMNNMSSTSLAILLGLYAGLRIGEICALRWENIDFSQDMIQISQTVQRLSNKDDKASKTKLIIMSAKTLSSQRYVVMPNFLTEYINAYSLFTKAHHQDYFLLTNDKKPLDPRTLQRRFHKVCQLFDLEITFHTLRHTYATNCVKLGIDIKSISEMLGHSHVSTTLNKYVHPSYEYKKQQVNKFIRP